MSALVINGKFLGAPLNGVHRTAAHFSQELLRRMGGEHTARLLAPPGATPSPEFPSLSGEILRGHFGTGQGWENVTLPRAARDALLVNFCNLGPVMHANSVTMIHDAQTFMYPKDSNGFRALRYNLLLPLLARRARRILTVSEFSRERLIAHGVGTAEKIDVVHNGTDHILAQAADPAIVDRLGLGRGDYVLTIGSSKFYKNLRTVFAAMADPLPGGQRLVIAGGPPEPAYRAAGWAPPAGAVFTGFVSDAELRALYENAGAFVFPSLTEGFGLPPVEAMHCGTPVISARAGAMPEVLGEAALLVRADQPDEYRAALTAVFSDDALAQRLRHDGARRAGQLTWEAAGDRLWALLRPLL